MPKKAHNPMVEFVLTDMPRVLRGDSLTAMVTCSQSPQRRRVVPHAAVQGHGAVRTLRGGSPRALDGLLKEAKKEHAASAAVVYGAQGKHQARRTAEVQWAQTAAVPSPRRQGELKPPVSGFSFS